MVFVSLDHFINRPAVECHSPITTMDNSNPVQLMLSLAPERNTYLLYLTDSKTNAQWILHRRYDEIQTLRRHIQNLRGCEDSTNRCCKSMDRGVTWTPFPKKCSTRYWKPDKSCAQVEFFLQDLIRVTFGTPETECTRIQRGQDAMENFLDIRAFQQRWAHELLTQVRETSEPECSTNDHHHILECAICYEAFSSTTTTTLPCAHQFHQECIQEWFGQQPSCPVCRAPFHHQANNPNPAIMGSPHLHHNTTCHRPKRILPDPTRLSTSRRTADRGQSPRPWDSDR